MGKFSWKIFLYGVVIAHFLLLFFNALAFFLLPFFQPWYVALPIMCFLYRLATVERMCPITNYENIIRKILGLRQINSFIGHYLTGPIKYRKWPY